jgi:hypothetical protein
MKQGYFEGCKQHNSISSETVAETTECGGGDNGERMDGVSYVD